MMATKEMSYPNDDRTVGAAATRGRLRVTKQPRLVRQSQASVLGRGADASTPLYTLRCSAAGWSSGQTEAAKASHSGSIPDPAAHAVTV